MQRSDLLATGQGRKRRLIYPTASFKNRHQYPSDKEHLRNACLDIPDPKLVWFRAKLGCSWKTNIHSFPLCHIIVAKVEDTLQETMILLYSLYCMLSDGQE